MNPMNPSHLTVEDGEIVAYHEATLRIRFDRERNEWTAELADGKDVSDTLVKLLNQYLPSDPEVAAAMRFADSMVSGAIVSVR